MRAPASTDFAITAGGEQFTVGRRVMRDEFAIGAEYSRLTEGVETPTRFLSYYARAFATAKVLLVAAPAGFDLEKLDPLEEDSYAKLIALYEAIIAREDDFRRKNGAGIKASGAGSVGDGGVLVSEKVHASTD